MKIELAHDSLAAKIYDKVSLEEKNLRKVEKFIQDRYAFYLSRDVLLTRDELDYIKPYRDQVDISAEQRQFIRKSEAATTRRRRILAAIVAGVFLAISSLAIYSLIQRNDAIAQTELAQKNEAEAQKNLKEAQRQEKLAQEQRQEAENQRQRAETQADIARKASTLAEQRAEAERVATRLAQAERKQADLARERAVKAREEALQAQNDEAKQRALAEEAQKAAEENYQQAKRLLRLSVAQSMAARSLQLDENQKQLKAKVAQQAYAFNKKNGGNRYDRTIYEGLYYATRELEGPSFNQLNGHRSTIRYMTYDQQGKQFFAGGGDGRLLRWSWNESVVEGKQIPQEVRRITNRDMALSPDGRWLVTAQFQAPYLQLWDLGQAQASAQTLPDFDMEILDLAFLPDGKGFLTLGADQLIREYTLGKDEVREIAQHAQAMRAMAIRPNGQEVAVIGEAGELVIWDINQDKGQTPDVVLKSGDISLYAVAYNQQGDRLVIGDEDGIAYVYGASRRNLIAQLPGHTARISDLKFSHDGKYLASACYDGSVQLWVVGQDKYETRLPIILRDHNSWVMSLAFSPDDQHLLTGGRDGQIKIWPTQPEMLASDICQHLEQNFTAQEWALYVGSDIDREATCEQLPLP
ncbi:MAG: hypothetical protein AAFR61_14180 [Bacteroidota bacterium]